MNDKKVLVVGAGAQGGACASILARDKDISEIVLADIDVDLPTSLKEYNIPMKDIPLISEYIFTKAEACPMSKFNPRRATLENITEFFSKALEGRESIRL